MAVKTLSELNKDVDGILHRVPDSVTELLKLGITSIEKYVELSGKVSITDPEKTKNELYDCYTNFMVAMTIVANILPNHKNHEEISHKGKKKELYTMLLNAVANNDAIDKIKDSIQKLSSIEDQRVQRFSKLRVHKDKSESPHTSPNGQVAQPKLTNFKNNKSNQSPNRLLAPINLHYRSRSPSPIRPKIEIDIIDSSVLSRYLHDEKGEKWYLQPVELYNILSDMPKSVLLLDIRSRKEFNQGHILFDNIVCIEPFSIQSNFDERDLSESLLVSPDFEQHLFEKRDLFELVVLYDSGYTVPKNATDFTNLPSYFKKLMSIINLRSALKPLKRNPMILSGGINFWKKLYGRSNVSEPKDDNLIQPISFPSRPLSFRKTSVVNSGSYSTSDIGDLNSASYSPDFSPAHFSPEFPQQSTGISVSSAPGSHSLAAPYARNIQEFSSPISSPTIDTSPFFPQQQLPAYLTKPSNGVTHSSPDLPSKVPYKYPSIRIPEPVVISPNTTRSPSENGRKRMSAPISLDFTSGLQNLGNSCYINCVLQCLTGTSQLTMVFLNNSYKRYINVNSKIGSKGVLANNYYEIVKLMSKSDGSYIVPSKFKTVCGSLNSEFRGYDQQDCQEFLNFLLDGLHEDLNQSGGHPPMNPLTEEDEANRECLPLRLASTIEWERYLKTEFSIIVDLFQGQYSSRLECLRCHHTSTTYQAFSTLSLPIPERRRSISIYDCFEEFTKLELLDGDDRWHCPKCKQFTRSTKKLQITILPKILIVHFKRFKQGFGLEKLDTVITYPISDTYDDDKGVIDLDRFWPKVTSSDEQNKLSQFISRGQVPPFKYKVYGVINHSGTLRGGHYTAYVYKGNTKKWCYYDDTKIYKNQKVSKVVSKDNYVLFLSRN